MTNEAVAKRGVDGLGRGIGGAMRASLWVRIRNVWTRELLTETEAKEWHAEEVEGWKAAWRRAEAEGARRVAEEKARGVAVMLDARLVSDQMRPAMENWMRGQGFDVAWTRNA